MVIFRQLATYIINLILVGRKRTTDVVPPTTAKHPKLATEMKTDQGELLHAQNSGLLLLSSTFLV